ncbi:alpha/beta hydrolase [Streptomyces alfalfae]|uniref:Alpha/beta hydrolase n=1 Tax=Streptomyces alfalfae TaxID=1642299 RepID=A0ABN4VQU9_9ACTN|nr:alpha/beta hydrolase [Streptomyces alfalfae]APY89910.1 alpha/beta hydrolase [Streptomyces alfalfae]AYA20368.1 alpha/beta hydrolase [Streptomyces fradiae]RXX42733.1 alpha/beta hydrolase [Streptomyces alfalfae]RZM86440.1 alpha/beta hydrolase [Streptomyces alfalfae]
MTHTPAPTIPDFAYVRLPGVGGVELSAAVGGGGAPVVLLHGFPQTHLMWRHVARRLADDHLVVCPDLRGYGASDKPRATDDDVYAKRTMAADIVALMAELGHDHFALVGHDRGALVAFRAGLDHPETITHLGILDVVPTLDMWDVLHGVSAAVGFHLFLMAQPPGLPETMIVNSADAFFGSFLDTWAKDPGAIPAPVRAEYLRASAAAVDSIVADYRASAGVDVVQDQADSDAGSQFAMPVAVVQQDWGARLGYDAAAVWRAWAPRLDHHLTEAGHFMAEEAPDEITAVIRRLLAA